MRYVSPDGEYEFAFLLPPVSSLSATSGSMLAGGGPADGNRESIRKVRRISSAAAYSQR